jgi:uncharacterized flavoprotein (TIGR03862 family)
MKRAVVIGAGPAGLMAAEMLAQSPCIQVDVFDAMPSVGRKLLLAGIGGLNITHNEAFEAFVSRYGARSEQVQPWLQALSPTALREWVHGLGVDTFVGSSQRVFPAEMKAAPLLRAWLSRLKASGVKFHARQRWLGIGEHARQLRFAGPQGESLVQADAVVLALGGASWKKLGSDGAWLAVLQSHGVDCAPLLPSNCGFDVSPPWSAYVREKFAGQPLKNVGLSLTDATGKVFSKIGEFVITHTGVEGSLVYAASSRLRDEIGLLGSATITLDLLPAHSASKVLQELTHPRGSKSLSSHLKSRLNMTALQLALLHEVLSAEELRTPELLCQGIKALPIRLDATRPIDEAISSAGGVKFEALTPGLMLQAWSGVFCAGEMIDWEAPTGGYLLNACWASGRVAGQACCAYLLSNR